MQSATKTKSTGELLFFRGIVVFGSAVGVGLSVANISYYDRIRKDTCNGISKTQAKTMYWVSIVFAIIFAILFIWSLYSFFHDSHKNEQVNEYEKNITKQEKESQIKMKSSDYRILW